MLVLLAFSRIVKMMSIILQPVSKVMRAVFKFV